MWYPGGHESTHLYSPAHRRRTAPDQSGLALLGCLCLAPLPDPAGQRARRARSGHCPPAGLRRPDGAQCDQGFNAQGLAVLQEGSSRPHRLRTAFSADSAQRLGELLHRSPRDFGREQTFWTLETAAQVSFEQGLIAAPDLGGERAARPAAAGHQLETGQALDHQSRSAVPAKKKARDRLIAWASQQPTGRLGLPTKSGGVAMPCRRPHAWQSPKQPVRLVEQSWRAADPDPKALACYGVLWQTGTPRAARSLADLAALRHRASGECHHHPVSGLVYPAVGRAGDTTLAADLG